MSAFDDTTELLCSGIISFPGDNGKTFRGWVTLPCGSFTDVRTPDSEFQLPFKHQIYRERARLNTCCYWSDTEVSENDLKQDQFNRQDRTQPEIFEFIHITTPTGVLPNIDVDKILENGSLEKINIPNPDLEQVGGWAHEAVPSFVVAPREYDTLLINGATSVPTKCQKSQAGQWNQGKDGSPPCNGAKTECPFYTGPKFIYIQDEHMAPGQPVKGQMVQELRQYIKDWTLLSDSQDAWEKSFEEPHIWGWDKEDQPLVRGSDGAETNIQDIPVYMILSKVYWDAKKEKAFIKKAPSQETGTESEGGDNNTTDEDRRDAPKFPTLIPNLGFSIKAPIEVRFPRVEKSSYDPSFSIPFIFEIFEKDHNKLYIAGSSLPVSNIYVINREFFPTFPDLRTITDIDSATSATIDSIITDIITESNTTGSVKGYRYVTSTAQRFWEVSGGLDLKANKENLIFCLVKNGDEWSSDYITVNCILHHVDIIQSLFESTLSAPATESLITRLANIKPLGNNISFDIINFLGSVSIDSSYHFYLLDRALTRFIRDSDTPRDSRFWKVIKEEKTVVGTGGDGGDLRWFKLDNCNRYAVEIKDPLLSSAVPMGLDRSWQPTKIQFNLNQEPGTSSHGPQQSTRVLMKVVDGFGFLGRSYTGSPIPINYMVVEPEDNIDLRVPAKESVLVVNLEIYKAVDSKDDGEDVLNDLLALYSDQNSYSSGGVTLSRPDEDDDLHTSPHLITFEDEKMTVSNCQKFDLSYVIEFKSNITGRVIGRKWIVGVAEISNSWARDVDILYSWLSTQSFNKVIPDYYKSIVYTNDGSEPLADALPQKFYQTNLDDTYTVYRPMCGDHDVSFGKPGPMFAPYEDCDYSYTNITELGLIITHRVDYAAPLDEKYRGPDLQRPTVYKHNVFGTLFPNCFFEYSMGTYSRGAAKWNGVAKLRGPISLNGNPLKWLRYTSLGFNFPVFGNIGREHVRIFKTMHFREYIYQTPGSRPSTGLGWMPSFPHISAESLFTSNKPRTTIDQEVRDLLDNTPIDIEDFSDLNFLLQRATETSVPSFLGDPLSESFAFERKKFDEVYKVKKIRDKNGRGTQWPPQGFYFNFRSDKVVWAYPEPKTKVGRDLSLLTSDILSLSPLVRGIVVTKPKDTEEFTDKFKRIVNEEFLEGKYDLKIKDITLDSIGDIVEEAYVTSDGVHKVYFNRFTGELLTKAYPTKPQNELYTVSGISNLNTYFQTLSQVPVIEPYFEYINQTEENNAPTIISEIDDFDNFGNLYLSTDKVYIYSKEGLDGPLDDVDSLWNCFIPSLNVEQISPKYLPKKQLNFSIEAGDFTGINPRIKFSSYPTTDPVERQGLSNTFLEEGGLYVTFFADSTDEMPFEWKPYSDADLTVTGNPNPDPREGFVGPVTITCEFKNKVELSHLEMSYEIYGLTDNNPAPGPLPIATPIKKDPSFKIELQDSNSNNIILVDKPEQVQVKYKKTTLKRDYKFSFKEASFTSSIAPSSPIVPFNTKRIIITIGARENNNGLKLSNCFVKALKLNDGLTESIIIVEAKHQITVGHSEDIPTNRYWAQDPSRLTGIVGAIDQEDLLEQAGITEFWRPFNFDKNDTVTVGKLRRHYAGKYLTWDTDSSNDDTKFLDGDVKQSEGRQAALINESLIRKATETFKEVSNYQSKYFINPFDSYNLSQIDPNSSLLSLNSSLLSLKANHVIEYKHNGFSADSVVAISIGTQSPGWQDEGFSACINPKTHVTGCIGPGGRGAVSYEDDQGTCRGTQGPGTFGLTSSLLDLPGIDRPGALLGTDPGAVLLQQALDPNSISEAALRNAQKESIRSRTDEYKQRNKRYNS